VHDTRVVVKGRAEDSDGRPIHPDTITRRFNKLVDRAGVPVIRLHDVRHTYATLSLDAGVDPKIVSDRIGHANMAYTLQIYTHRSTGRDRAAAERVAGVIFGAEREGLTTALDGTVRRARHKRTRPSN
jgi:integrase